MTFPLFSGKRELPPHILTGQFERRIRVPDGNEIEQHLVFTSHLLSSSTAKPGSGDRMSRIAFFSKPVFPDVVRVFEISQPSTKAEVMFEVRGRLFIWNPQDPLRPRFDGGLIIQSDTRSVLKKGRGTSRAVEFPEGYRLQLGASPLFRRSARDGG